MLGRISGFCSICRMLIREMQLDIGWRFDLGRYWSRASDESRCQGAWPSRFRSDGRVRRGRGWGKKERPPLIRISQNAWLLVARMNAAKRGRQKSKKIYDGAMSPIRRTKHAVSDIKHHMVWILKFRKKILAGEVAEFTRQIFLRIA